MRIVGLVISLVLMVLLWPATALALDGPSPSCNQGSCVGWFTSVGVPVAVSWTAPSGASLTDCHFETITTDTSGSTVSCAAYYAAEQQTVTASVTVRRDTAPPQVTGINAARPPDENGWYNHAVTVTLAGADASSGIASCDAPTYSGPDSGTAVVGGVCRDAAGNTSAPTTLALKYDATAPSANASPARGPDENGWYTKPLTISFNGSDATSGIATCTAPQTYPGPDAVAVDVGGACSDVAGNRVAASTTLRYDSTPPTVVATPLRPADVNGWYSKPLSITFKGTDLLSGIASCTPPVSYSRPDSADAVVSGMCRDAAGNEGPAALSFKFDATPPATPTVKSVAGGGSVSLTWTPTGGATTFMVLRGPYGKRGLSVVWRGTARKFVDRSVKNGTRYRYVVRALDRAGNTSERNVLATPVTAVFSPVPGSVTRGPPTVRWVADRRARFYNVQVYRARVKVLSLWPTGARLRLPASWVYRGERLTLKHGAYRIFVWPAFGSPAHPRYGKLIGQTSFTLKA